MRDEGRERLLSYRCDACSAVEGENCWRMSGGIRIHTSDFHSSRHEQDRADWIKARDARAVAGNSGKDGNE
jgi:hypothetical protein